MDITGVDPDIWYRVDITVSNSPFSSYGDINIPEFNFRMDDYNGTNTFLNAMCVSSVGLLDAVLNLTSQSLGEVIHLTWDDPFSLDITGVDPDIWYRVEITVTDDPLSTYFISRIVNVKEFNLTMDDYNNTSTSVIYEFRVTPINGAGNGTSAYVTGYFSGRELLMWIRSFVIAGTVSIPFDPT